MLGLHYFNFVLKGFFLQKPLGERGLLEDLEIEQADIWKNNIVMFSTYLFGIGSDEFQCSHSPVCSRIPLL